MAAGHGNFIAMMESDSLTADLLSAKTAAEDEAGADLSRDAAAVPSGPGIATADNGEAGEDAGSAGAAAGASGDGPDRTDDPMTLYLRDVGGKPLLTREGEPTIADAVLDLIVHNAYRIELKGESQRKRNKPPPLDGGGNRAPA